MHDTALAIGTLFLATYPVAPGGVVVDVGAYDVNGSLRVGALPGVRYVGVDISAGPGVDVVVAGGTLPFADGSVDCVLASSVFEHDPAFWLTFQEMRRIVRPGGTLYISAPSNGTVHRYPLDCWRFYPDAGRALERASRRDDHPATLLESFVAERAADHWNDFVAVFQRDGGPDLHTARLHPHFACRNVVDGPGDAFLHAERHTEDMRLMQAALAAGPVAEADAMIRTLYDVLVHRAPDAHGRAAFTAMLAQEDGFRRVLTTMLASPEFRQRFLARR